MGMITTMINMAITMTNVSDSFLTWASTMTCAGIGFSISAIAQLATLIKRR